MKYRALDSNGDYSFGKNMQDFVANNGAVVQAINTNLKLLRGEWWEDLSEGFPLFQNVLTVNNGSIDHVKATDMLVKERILSTQGVKEIVSFVSSLVDRHYSAVCTVKTSFGSIASAEVAF